MPYNYAKLKGKIREKYTTQDEFAKAIGIGRVSLSLKLNSKAKFTQNEIQKSINVLNLEQNEIANYFFCERSSEM